MPNLAKILPLLRQKAESAAEQGRFFERVVALHFLQHDSAQKAEYARVWLWNDWPGNRGKQDTGIDLVAQTHDGELAAIQAKCYAPEHQLSKADLDTFISASDTPDFSRRIVISTTDKWGKHADDLAKNPRIPLIRIGPAQLDASHIDWEAALQNRIKPPQKNAPRPHQRQAIKQVTAGLADADRGKLIMACGTGKTYTALKIAEQQTKLGDIVLFLAPSLSLVAQALREWSDQAAVPLRNFIVCSDSSVGADEDIKLRDIVIPATTNPAVLARKLSQPQEPGTERLNVIFATYHSLPVIAAAQKEHGAPDIALAICDEAHRTTGVDLAAPAKTPAKAKTDKKSTKTDKKTAKADKATDLSFFLKIHSNEHIRAKNRLYMTATPRIYTASAAAKAKEEDAVLYSMDDETLFGKEFYRLGFSEAVEKDLLSDYKVVILAVNEDEAKKSAQAQEIDPATLTDSARAIGCWNALRKNFPHADQSALTDAERAHPMRRAVMFANTIAASQKAEEIFSRALDNYNVGVPNSLKCEIRHLDGTMPAARRAQDIAWLKQDPAEADPDSAPAEPPATDQPVCRLLTNARCLSEGVDVPALDSVIFLHPRRSQVDIVQSVGRVMRRAEGKQYGYIILPIATPPGADPAEELKQNPQKYDVIWRVLQALRAHDERFNAMINAMDLNQKLPDKIIIAGIGYGDELNDSGGAPAQDQPAKAIQTDLNLAFQQWKDAIIARIVKTCGEKHYWETWAKNVADIAEANIQRIRHIVNKGDDKIRRRFAKFLAGLQANLNPAVSQEDAIEMLAQHLVTRPVFSALFQNYEFAKINAVSHSMNAMIVALNKAGLAKEDDSLQRFYDSVRRRAEGVATAAGRQRILMELYEKFFALAFKRQSEKLGIVYTPTQVVDFILQSADAALQKEFGRKLADRNVHILDPFTGTGAFIARLMRPDNPLIPDSALPRKYAAEIHANEITLLAYYIAAVNIESIYHDRIGGDYAPFGGIVLADTFQMSENDGALSDDFLYDNSARAKSQRKKPIQVIIGNPPYSAGQRSANDDNANQKYPALDNRLTDTYVKDSTATLKNSLYDSYIRSIRWASDRITDEGIVAFVTNGSFIDGTAAAGVRKHLLRDFSAVYCFNLRGNIRKFDKREGGNIFGNKSMTPVAITILVKKKGHQGAGKLYYHDIGDDLSTEAKLAAIATQGDYTTLPWQTIAPDAQHDWINQRSPVFATWQPMGDKADKTKSTNKVVGLFSVYSNGLKSNRDPWVYDHCRDALSRRIKGMLAVYNTHVKQHTEGNHDINYDPAKINWSSTLLASLSRHIKGEHNEENIRTALYRPFCKQYLYLDKLILDRPAIAYRFFNDPSVKNPTICVPGIGSNQDFSAIMVDIVPDLSIVSASQCFPLYYYPQKADGALARPATDANHDGRQENITDSTLQQYQDKYGKTVTKQDIFYYVYGILHAPAYKTQYANDLKKTLPRIPMVRTAAHFHAFAEAGRQLADLHINYESAPEHPLTELAADLVATPDSRIVKMRFAGKQGAWDKSKIIINQTLTLANIPAEAYAYVINGKSAIEWIMDRYQITQDKASGIRKDPNQYSDNPRYIPSLIKKVTHISLASTQIINSLPTLEI